MSPTGEYDRGTDRPHCGEQTVNTLRVGPQDAVTGAQHSDKTDVLPVEPHFMAGRAWPTFSTDTELGLCSIYSHCDSVFQQSDQLSETVSALVPSLKHAVIHSPCRSVRSVSRKDRPEKSCFPSLSRVHIFPCGCKFSHVGASFLLWVRVFSCGCEFFNLHFPDTMTRWKSCRHKDIPAEKPGIENAASRRNRTVSPDGVHPTRAGNIPQILLRKLFQRAF